MRAAVSRARALSARVAAALPPWRPCAGARHGARSARLRPRAWRERPVSSDRARRSPPSSPDEGGNQTSSVIIKRLLGRAALMREVIRGHQRQSARRARSPAEGRRANGSVIRGNLRQSEAISSVVLGHLRKVGEPTEALAHTLVGELLRRELDDRSSHLMREAIRRPR
jgi:hypothetical protein